MRALYLQPFDGGYVQRQRYGQGDHDDDKKHFINSHIYHRSISIAAFNGMHDFWSILIAMNEQFSRAFCDHTLDIQKSTTDDDDDDDDLHTSQQ